ncbi:exported zinc metalloprotease YfgC precursor [Vibrio ponticus]|nr:exported zinc metalloprotease YfgC precursor [Vibrio ponticus]
MLLTHPLPQDRITDTRARAQTYPAKRVNPSLNYHLARARIVARYAGIKSDAALDWLERTEKKAQPDIKPAMQYGRALVYLDNNQLDKAAPILTKLYQQDNYNRFYLDALSDLYIAQKQPEKASTMLERALKSEPNNPVLMINYANSLIAQEKFEPAIRVLQRYTHDNGNDVNGWHLLSEANIKLGNSQEDLAARAEILALKANWNKAIQYYTQAGQMAELGSLEQARYDARIDQLMVQRDRFMALQ